MAGKKWVKVVVPALILCAVIGIWFVKNNEHIRIDI